MSIAKLISSNQTYTLHNFLHMEMYTVHNAMTMGHTININACIISAHRNSDIQ